MSAHEVFVKYCSIYVINSATGQFFYHSGSLPLDCSDGYTYGLCEGVLIGLLRGGAISASEYSSCSAYLKSLRFGMLS